MPWLFFLAACAIPAFYAVGLIARTGDNFTTTEFWRFWVVHLWVEDFLELFTTVMVAYMFVLLGVVRERIALTVVFLDIVLYSVGGVIGTMHHLYFSGEPAEHMALGAFFSAAEVIPLTFLTVEAWSFLQLGAAQESRSQTPFPHRWAVMFLVSVGFWNFLGAGIFGFLINLPIVSYYEIGTALTANHGHAAMMGVYGMLALGLAMFCLRYLIPADKWPERWARICFWSTNIGLAWMCFATLLPLGILQLYKSVDKGYFEARELKFLTNHTNALIEWLRLPGRRRLHRRRRAPGALHRLPRHPPHRQAGDARRAGRHPLHRDRPSRRAPRRWPTRRPRPQGSHERRGRPRGRLRRRCSSAARSRSSGCRRTRTGARCASAPPASPTTRRTTTGSAPRASTSGRTSSTTSCGSSATAPARTSATPAREARAARTPTAAARSCGRSTRGRTRRPAASTAVIALLLVALARPDRRRRGRAPPRAAGELALLAARCSCCALAARWLLRDLRLHPANFPQPKPAHGLAFGGTEAGREASAERSRTASQ